MLEDRQGGLGRGDALPELVAVVAVHRVPGGPIGALAEQVPGLLQGQTGVLAEQDEPDAGGLRGPYTRLPLPDRAGVSRPMSSQCRSTCVASPNADASSPMDLDRLDFMST
jgi:hypothetical protein